MVGTKGPQAPGTGVSCVSPFLFPGPACLQATASPPSSHPSVTDPLKARVLASGVGYTRLWRPKPAFPHPEWSLSRTVSFAHTRWGGFGGLGETLSLVHENQPPWSCQGEHHRLRDTKYVSQGPPRAVSELPPPPEHNISKHLRPLIETGSITCESTLPVIKLKLTFEIFPLWNMTQKRTRCILTTYL